MKIAILNLPFDSNYGGNLQRFALVSVLQKMGHQVEHINLKLKRFLPWYKIPYSYSKRIIKKYLLREDVKIFYEAWVTKQKEEDCLLAREFYNRYIPHTLEVFSARDLKQMDWEQYDCVVVGSDQVWRKDMTTQIGLKNYFFDFIKKNKIKRIAYAASFGKESYSLNFLEKKRISKLYQLFDAVSVREFNGVDILLEWNCVIPSPQVVLDPTLLLDANDYLKIIENGNTENLTEGKIYSYVLDRSSRIDDELTLQSKRLNVSVYKFDVSVSKGITIEQWLRNIYDSAFVVTDSFHGVVFSIIFGKQFVYTGNGRRGNSRVDSLCKILKLNTQNIDYSSVSLNLVKARESACTFLSNNLK